MPIYLLIIANIVYSGLKKINFVLVNIKIQVIHVNLLAVILHLNLLLLVLQIFLFGFQRFCDLFSFGLILTNNIKVGFLNICQNKFIWVKHYQNVAFDLKFQSKNYNFLFYIKLFYNFNKFFFIAMKRQLDSVYFMTHSLLIFFNPIRFYFILIF